MKRWQQIVTFIGAIFQMAIIVILYIGFQQMRDTYSVGTYVIIVLSILVLCMNVIIMCGMLTICKGKGGKNGKL